MSQLPTEIWELIVRQVYLQAEFDHQDIWKHPFLTDPVGGGWGVREFSTIGPRPTECKYSDCHQQTLKGLIEDGKVDDDDASMAEHTDNEEQSSEISSSTPVDDTSSEDQSSEASTSHATASTVIEGDSQVKDSQDGTKLVLPESNQSQESIEPALPESNDSQDGAKLILPERSHSQDDATVDLAESSDFEDGAKLSQGHDDTTTNQPLEVDEEDGSSAHESNASPDSATDDSQTDESECHCESCHEAFIDNNIDDWCDEDCFAKPWRPLANVMQVHPLTRDIAMKMTWETVDCNNDEDFSDEDEDEDDPYREQDRRLPFSSVDIVTSTILQGCNGGGKKARQGPQTRQAKQALCTGPCLYIKHAKVRLTPAAVYCSSCGSIHCTANMLPSMSYYGYDSYEFGYESEIWDGYDSDYGSLSDYLEDYVPRLAKPRYTTRPASPTDLKIEKFGKALAACHALKSLELRGSMAASNGFYRELAKSRSLKFLKVNLTGTVMPREYLDLLTMYVAVEPLLISISLVPFRGKTIAVGSDDLSPLASIITEAHIASPTYGTVFKRSENDVRHRFADLVELRGPNHVLYTWFGRRSKLIKLKIEPAIFWYQPHLLPLWAQLESLEDGGSHQSSGSSDTTSPLTASSSSTSTGSSNSAPKALHDDGAFARAAIAFGPLLRSIYGTNGLKKADEATSEQIVELIHSNEALAPWKSWFAEQKKDDFDSRTREVMAQVVLRIKSCLAPEKSKKRSGKKRQLDEAD
ncbi:unnamed protein product [Sympodiomycopsis kandeliae]